MSTAILQQDSRLSLGMSLTEDSYYATVIRRSDQLEMTTRQIAEELGVPENVVCRYLLISRSGEEPAKIPANGDLDGSWARMRWMLLCGYAIAVGNKNKK